MSDDQFPRPDLRGTLEEGGFALVNALTGGPMGSANWRFSDGIVDVEIINDRGHLAATAGPHGGPAFEAEVWANLMEVQLPGQSVEQHVGFFLQNLNEIRSLITEPNIETRLRDTNWIRVKERLGLDPSLKRPGSTNSA